MSKDRYVKISHGVYVVELIEDRKVVFEQKTLNPDAGSAIANAQAELERQGA